MLTYQSPGVSEFDLLTDTPAGYGGHGGKVVVVTGAETGLTFTDAPTFSSITIADGGTIGQAAGPLLTFDDTLNYLEITGCKVIIGGTIPLGTLHVRTAASGALAPSGFADEFIIEGTGSMGMTFMANGGGAANIYFADDGSNQDASIGYNFSARTLSLAVLNGAHMLMYPGEFVINEFSYDVDFRVESNGNINMLYVDGGTNRVGIGKIPTDTFDVAGNIVLSGTVDGVDVAGANAAQYVCIALDANIANERVLTGTANQITITDNGAGGTVVLSTPQDIHTGASPTFADVYVPDGGTFGIIGNELLTFNAAGTAVFSGCSLGVGLTPSRPFDVNGIIRATRVGVAAHYVDMSAEGGVASLNSPGIDMYFMISSSIKFGLIAATGFMHVGPTPVVPASRLGVYGNLTVGVNYMLAAAAAPANGAIIEGDTGIGVPDPHSKLEVGGAISSATLVLSAAGPTDNLDVSGVNTIFIDTSLNNVILGGTVGGVDGQILCIVVDDPTNDTTIENIEGTGNQDFYLHAGADETMTSEYGGWTFINHGGDHWHDASHAKHV